MRSCAAARVRRVASVGCAVSTSSSETAGARRASSAGSTPLRRAARTPRRATRAGPAPRARSWRRRRTRWCCSAEVDELEVEGERAQHAPALESSAATTSLARSPASPLARLARRRARAPRRRAGSSPSCSTSTCPSTSPSRRTSRRRGASRRLRAQTRRGRRRGSRASRKRKRFSPSGPGGVYRHEPHGVYRA